MDAVATLKNQLNVARNEMKNLRQQLISLKKKHDADVKLIVDLLKRPSVTTSCEKMPTAPKHRQDDSQESFNFKPVAHIESMFKQKNGTPRQAGVCQNASASLVISRSIFSNPEHSLQGLNSFSHLWILFVFHKNDGQYTGAKIKPPRLDGAKLGLYATRCPYRPNPIGLTLAKIEKIEGHVIHLLGIDLLDGTPVLDIKPYIPQYDNPSRPMSSLRVLSSSDGDDKSIDRHGIAEDRLGNSTSIPNILPCRETVCVDESNTADQSDSEKLTNSLSSLPTNCSFNIEDASLTSSTGSGSSMSAVSYADWLENPPASALRVTFTPSVEAQLLQFDDQSQNTAHRLRRLRDAGQLRSAIVDILSADPRSAYRRKHCTDRLYYLTVDEAHVTSWFDGQTVEVLKIKASS